MPAPVSWVPSCPTAPWASAPTIPGEANAVAERLATACFTAGVEEREAVLSAESLAGYLLGWGGR